MPSAESVPRGSYRNEHAGRAQSEARGRAASTRRAARCARQGCGQRQPGWPSTFAEKSTRRWSRSTTTTRASATRRLVLCRHMAMVDAGQGAAGFSSRRSGIWASTR
ncbi:MAG: hypothetical protein MZW92_36280 [Comamonadaceae bacterium]|nr:hypothetical protein [Comamonadaceae bacterium]